MTDAVVGIGKQCGVTKDLFGEQTVRQLEPDFRQAESAWWSSTSSLKAGILVVEPRKHFRSLAARDDLVRKTSGLCANQR
jgi:hypothetical protein